MKETKVVGLIDGMEVQLSVGDVEGMPMEMAEKINRIRDEEDHIEELWADYDRHRRDKLTERIRYAIQTGKSTDMTDPLDKVADPRADIFSILYPQKEKDSKMVMAVKQVIKELSKNQKTLFFKRYVLRMTFDEIAGEEYLITGVRVTKQAVSQRHQRMLAQVEKRLGQKVQIPS